MRHVVNAFAAVGAFVVACTAALFWFGRPVPKEPHP